MPDQFSPKPGDTVRVTYFGVWQEAEDGSKYAVVAVDDDRCVSAVPDSAHVEVLVDSADFKPRREAYAAALFNAVQGPHARLRWEDMAPPWRAVWYARAEAAMALADIEQKQLDRYSAPERIDKPRPEFWECASPEAIHPQIRRATRQLGLWRHRVKELELLHRIRLRQIEAGMWPGPAAERPELEPVTAGESGPVFQLRGGQHDHWAWHCRKETGGCGYQTPWLSPTEPDAQRAYDEHRETCSSTKDRATAPETGRSGNTTQPKD